ncbi:MAG: thioredoxin domain-containing protein [Acidobacteria bacterium]|nr:thioredoxin domain-containing protein [Acidobacteriota bacterium]
MQLFAPILAVACLLSSAFAADSKKTAPPAAPAKSALDKAMIEAYVRHLFVWGAQIKVEIDDPKASQLPGFLDVGVHASAGNARQDEVFYVSKDGQKMVRGAVFDVAQNPFKADLEKLKTEFQPSFGTPGAPVVLVVFSDFQCPYCKDEAKMLRSNLPGAYPKQVRVYFKDLPLDQIHPWARPAAIAGRCVFKQNPGAFWDYHDWIFEHQAEVTADNLKSKVLEFAKGKEIDVLQLSRCLDTKATEAEVDKSVAESRALKVTGTPTLFVNGRRLPNQVGWPDLRAIIDFEIEYQKTAKNAGEDCGCEVKLPTPGLN